MDIEQISQYFLPLLIFLFYVLGGRKKKKVGPVNQEDLLKKIEKPLTRKTKNQAQSVLPDQEGLSRGSWKKQEFDREAFQYADLKQTPIAKKQSAIKTSPIKAGSSNAFGASSLPPAQRTLSDFESVITNRDATNLIEKRMMISAISDERASSLVSGELKERIGFDQAYAIKPRYRVSRGRALLNQMPNLKTAFVIQEIFRKFDDF